MTTLTNEQLLDGVNPKQTMLGDIKQIEYDRAIKVHEAYRVHNRYHIFASQHGGSSVEFFTDDTAPFGMCFGGKCDVDYHWFKPVREHVQHPIHSIRTYGGLLIVETTGDVRYFDFKALPAVLEYTIAETYLAQ